MSLTGNERFGVLLMTYGSPSSLDDVPRYIRAVRGGRDDRSGVRLGLLPRHDQSRAAGERLGQPGVPRVQGLPDPLAAGFANRPHGDDARGLSVMICDADCHCTRRPAAAGLPHFSPEKTLRGRRDLPHLGTLG